MKKLVFIAVSMLFSVIIPQASADVKLSAILSDHMVLQQKAPVPIWGRAEPGENISVKADWQWFGSTAKADKDGKWMVKLQTPKAGGPHTITITAGNTLTLNDVLIGEVWLCSGQSNMEWPVSQALNPETEINRANYPNIRFFTVQNTVSQTPLDDCAGSWSVCSPETVQNFSAIGYFYGQILHSELNVPIGLISADWGGTPAEAWTSIDTIKKFDEFVEALKQIQSIDLEKLEQEFSQKFTDWNERLATSEEGTKSGWYNFDFDDSSWKTMELPCIWDQTELADFDGAVWFRKRFNLPPSWSKHDQTISLGPIDDIDTVWVNNVKIGTTTDYSAPRKYTAPASALRTGSNIIAVRVIDLHGEGGIYGKKEQMSIKPTEAPDHAAATLAGEWYYKAGSAAKDLPAVPQRPQSFSQYSPIALYNGMIAPLVPFRIAGAIWYQGESNASRAKQYSVLFPAMIEDWRTNWKQGNFPFYFVQIAPFKYDPEVASYELRDVQRLSLSTPNTGMAVTSDIGNINNIHPKNKQDVGKRLALWAFAKTYGCKDITYSGPLYKSMKIEGDKIRLFFDHVDGGLVAKDGPLTYFTIAGKDKSFVPANAVIEDNTVVVSSEQVQEPTAVRFAWSNTAEPNLFNAAGLPASTFRTDSWD